MNGYQIIFIIAAVFELGFSFAIFLIFTIGLDLEEKSDKIELSGPAETILKGQRTFIYSFEELPSDTSAPEISPLGYLSFSTSFCNCSSVEITDEQYKFYSHKIYETYWYICSSLGKYGCTEIDRGEKFGSYYSFNGKKYLIEKKTVSYQKLIANSVTSSESCPTGQKRCGLMDSYGNYLCVGENDNCPLSSIIVNGQSYGYNNAIISDFGLNVSSYVNEEYSTYISQSYEIPTVDKINKYELLKENNILVDLEQTYFENNVKYPLTDARINSTMVKLVYQTADKLPNSLYKECYNNIMDVMKIAEDFNDMIYSGLNGLSFGLAVGWMGAAFYFYSAGCVFQQSSPIVTLVLFSILMILTYVQLITNSIFDTKIYDTKYEFEDLCSAFNKDAINKLYRNRTIVTI